MPSSALRKYIEGEDPATGKRVIDEVIDALTKPVSAEGSEGASGETSEEGKENEGFNTKEEYSRWMSKNVKMTAGRFWGTDYIDMLMASLAYKGEEPYASWKKLPDDELITPYHDPEKINIIIVGGETSPA